MMPVENTSVDKKRGKASKKSKKLNDDPQTNDSKQPSSVTVTKKNSLHGLKNFFSPQKSAPPPTTASVSPPPLVSATSPSAAPPKAASSPLPQAPVLSPAPSVEKTKVAPSSVVFEWSHDPSAREVFLAGSFDNWSARHKLTKDPKGNFFCSLDLQSGDYQYKFIVDGEWKHDLTKDFAQDASGCFTNNSIHVN
eukprot:Sdes_comp9458_c0_seq1m924